METERKEEAEKSGEATREDLPRINLRVLVYCALGLVFGIFLYFRIRFGSFLLSDLCFLFLLLALSVFPLRPKRILCVVLALAVFGGTGAALAHLRTERYLDAREGTFSVTGTVCSFTVKNGRTEAVLEGLSFNGAPVEGKLRPRLLSEEARAGDIVTFEGHVRKNDLPMSGDDYQNYLFYSDIRYTVSEAEYEKTGTSKNPFHRVNSALYDVLTGHMEEGGEVAYALLTGHSAAMDEEISEIARRGGVAHIFAVSGLHIGILFGAVLLLFKPLGRKAYFPALALAFLYTAFCAFTVSSVRALIMCAVLGGYAAIGRKYDFLSSISLAALAVLLLDPADFLSPGFKLSFGACLGLALFAGPLRRLFSRVPHAPRFLCDYLSANLSVQLFTFPILLETFGYFSVWGFLLNLILVPLLPVFFLTALLCAILALAIPPAASLFLLLPEGLFSLLFLLFSGGFEFVLKGFALGMGATVFLCGAVFLSERVRWRPRVRALLAAGVLALFSLALVLENYTFAGVRVDVSSTGEVLLRTPSSSVLVLGKGELESCEAFLRGAYGGKLDAVFILAEDEVAAINHAAFLDAEEIVARDEVATGLAREVRFAREGEAGGLRFRFVKRDRLLIFAEGATLEISTGASPELGADFFVFTGAGRLKFFLRDGIMVAWNGLLGGARGTS